MTPHQKLMDLWCILLFIFRIGQ